MAMSKKGYDKDHPYYVTATMKAKYTQIIDPVIHIHPSIKTQRAMDTVRWFLLGIPPLPLSLPLIELMQQRAKNMREDMNEQLREKKQ